MSNTNQPTGQQLTPESLWDAYSRLIPASYSECAPHDDIVVMTKDDFVLCLEQYASQQVAAIQLSNKKDVQELQQSYSLSLQISTILREQRNQALNKNEEKDARIAELEAVKKERDREALKNESLHLTIARKEQSITDWQNNYHILKTQLDEAVKECDHFKMLFTTTMNGYKEYILLLEEAVKMLKNMVGYAEDALKWYRIKGSVHQEFIAETADDIRKATTFISSLSSGETKPVSPWISANKQPEFDGEYLVHIVRKNDCGTFSKYQRVKECIMNEWVIDENERVTHYRSLDEGPDRMVKLLDTPRPS